MSIPVLVAFATRSGSTGEVAKAIADSLKEAGLAAEVLPMHAIESLEGRTAVVLGAPLYIGRFPREFHRFVCRHREALSKLRPWCFVLGPTRDLPADFEAARKQAEKQLSRYAWFKPQGMHIFGGRWDPKSLPFPFSLIQRLPMHPLDKIPAVDARDWAGIRDWATGIAEQIKPAA